MESIVFTDKSVEIVAMLAEIPAENVSKTLAVSATVLLRYKASASCRVNDVEELKKFGLKSIPKKDGLGAVLVAIYFNMIFFRFPKRNQRKYGTLVLLGNSNYKYP